MWSRDWRDMAVGAFFLALGLGAAIYAGLHYPLGSLRNIGPGMFPLVIGCAMALCGLGIFVPATIRAGPRFEWEPGVALPVLASIAAFAITLPLLGLIPATVALTFIARLAEPLGGIARVLALGIILGAATWLVFGALLGVPVPALRWPL